MSDPEKTCPETPLYQPTYTVDGEDIARSGDCGVPTDVPPGEPTADQPAVGDVRTFTFDEISVLCDDIGLSPEMVEGVIAQLLTQHFSDPAWIIYPELRQFVWSPIPTQSKLPILPLNRWNELTDSNSPAIVYADLGQRPQRIAIGDQFAHSRLQPNRQSFARAYQGSHRLMCIGQNDFQAAMLATEIDRWLTEFSFQLLNRLPFHDFQIADRQPPQAFSALGDRVGVALSLSYSYIWSWETTPYGAPVKSASVHFNRPQG